MYRESHLFECSAGGLSLGFVQVILGQDSKHVHLVHSNVRGGTTCLSTVSWRGAGGTCTVRCTHIVLREMWEKRGSIIIHRMQHSSPRCPPFVPLLLVFRGGVLHFWYILCLQAPIVTNAEGGFARAAPKSLTESWCHSVTVLRRHSGTLCVHA